jgi:hypothetical protein
MYFILVSIFSIKILIVVIIASLKLDKLIS